MGFKKRENTSWQKVSGWYNKLVSDKGHYYHQHIVTPGVLKLLDLKPDSALLDLACGQGVLERHIPAPINYQGIDISRNLIESAQKMTKNSNHRFAVGDVTKTLPINKKDFTHACIILAMQNIEKAELVLSNLKNYLQPKSILVIVLNHPCFRIPRQSSWGIDEGNKLQYRRINRYLSSLKIPINMHPGEGSSPVTWSFHNPFSYYSKILHDNKFKIDLIEEWASDKESAGRAARMENRGRAEFPLFLAIKAVYRYGEISSGLLPGF